jgi:hypothetical protein
MSVVFVSGGSNDGKCPPEQKKSNAEKAEN